MNANPTRWQPRSQLVIAAVCVLAVAAGTILMVALAAPRDASTPPTPSPARSGVVAAQPTPGGVPIPEPLASNPVAAKEITALRKVTLPTVASNREQQIGPGSRQHPDLYAAEFVRALLTMDFRQARDEHLAWVAGESVPTAEPLVIGLVPPELRDRLGVYSVTDSATGPAPVPSGQEWTQLGALQGYTTIRDLRVSEPLAWSNAVEAGRVTDPGATARAVTATVTVHTLIDGRPIATDESIELIANFEGPPTRAAWGFVTVVTYTSIALGPS